jgi:hypothetical protein
MLRGVIGRRYHQSARLERGHARFVAVAPGEYRPRLERAALEDHWKVDAASPNVWSIFCQVAVVAFDLSLQTETVIVERPYMTLSIVFELGRGCDIYEQWKNVRRTRESGALDLEAIRAANRRFGPSTIESLELLSGTMGGLSRNLGEDIVHLRARGETQRAAVLSASALAEAASARDCRRLLRILFGRESAWR